MLEGLGEHARALDADGLPLEVDAGDHGLGVAHGGEPEAGHREAALVDEDGLAAQLLDHGVQDVAERRTHVVAECAEVDADLRGGHPGAAVGPDAVEEVLDQGAHAIVDLVDLRGDGLQHRIAEQADLSFSHSLLPWVLGGRRVRIDRPPRARRPGHSPVPRRPPRTRRRAARSRRAPSPPGAASTAPGRGPSPGGRGWRP